MNFEFSEEDLALRSELRDRIKAYFPDGFPSIFVESNEPLEASSAFCRDLARDGLLTLAWREEFGGKNASLWTQVVVAEEMWAHGEPRGGQYYGVNWLGPTIMAFGTAEQKEKYLPLIAAGEGFWCQGYSEPDAGSDLASLRLKAVKVEGGWRLTGQKIWTSYGGYARWCILAARTDPSGPKHHGITLFLLPMNREGIEVRPIRSPNGPHHFNEVFFEDTFVAESEVVGEVDKGWDVIGASLSFERVGTARYARSERLLSEARESLISEVDQPEEQTVERWVNAAVSTRVARLLSYRAVAEREASTDGRVPALYSSVARAANTLNDQFTTSTVFELLAPDSLYSFYEPETASGHVPLGGELEHEWRQALGATVAAGTLEVQLMVIARDVLGRSQRET